MTNKPFFKFWIPTGVNGHFPTPLYPPGVSREEVADVGIFDLKRQLGIGSFEEQWPGLADSIREGQEAARRALSGPTAAEIHQAEMEQIYSNVRKQAQRIQEQTRITIFDDKEN